MLWWCVALSLSISVGIGVALRWALLHGQSDWIAAICGGCASGGVVLALVLVISAPQIVSDLGGVFVQPLVP